MGMATYERYHGELVIVVSRGELESVIRYPRTTELLTIPSAELIDPCETAEVEANRETGIQEMRLNKRATYFRKGCK